MLTQYRYFVAVVDNGGITSAAAALGISQPAITRSLQALEFQLDVKLIERGSGTLTDAGTLLLKRARILLAEQSSLLRDVAALAQDTEAITYVNGSPMTAVALLPRILVRMHVDHPQIRVSVRGDNGANYQWKREALLAGDLDVAITILDSTLGDIGLIQVPLFEPELKIVVSRATPDWERIDFADLQQRNWIMPPEGSSPRAVVENEFRMRGFNPPRKVIEISDWRIALDLVHATDFTTAIPFHPACFEDQFDRFRILPFHFEVRPLAIGLLMRPAAAKRPATSALIQTAETVIAEWSA